MNAPAITPISINQEPWERPDVAAHIPGALERITAEGMNSVESAERASTRLNQLCTMGHDGGFIRFNGETDAENEARRVNHNNQCWAEYYVLKNLMRGCEGTPKMASWYIEKVREGLPRLQDLARALMEVKEIEEECLCLETASPTSKRLQERYESLAHDLSDYLSYSLTSAQVELLQRLTAPGKYRSPRFRLGRKAANYLRTLTFLDIEIRLAVPFRFHFESVLKRCSTQAEVRTALDCWGVSYKSERREGVTVIIVDGWEITPS